MSAYSPSSFTAALVAVLVLCACAPDGSEQPAIPEAIEIPHPALVEMEPARAAAGQPASSPQAMQTSIAINAPGRSRRDGRHFPFPTSESLSLDRPLTLAAPG